MTASDRVPVSSGWKISVDGKAEAFVGLENTLRELMVAFIVKVSVNDG